MLVESSGGLGVQVKGGGGLGRGGMSCFAFTSNLLFEVTFHMYGKVISFRFLLEVC